jgi:hypothetical protein
MAKLSKSEGRSIRRSLAAAVAGRKVSDAKVNRIAEAISAADYRIAGIDVCIYGICLDYILDAPVLELERLQVKEGILRQLEVFPYGIVAPELLHVRAAFDFEEIPRPRG